MKSRNLIITVPRTNSIIAIAPRKLKNPLSLTRRPRAIDSREINRNPIEIHTDILPHRTPPLTNPKLLAAIHATMILNTPLTRTLDFLAAPRHVAVIVIVMVVYILPPKVVHKHVPNAAMRQHSLREINNTVFDDIRIHTMNMIRLIAPHNRVIAIKPIHLELAQLVGLDHVRAVLDKRIFNREVNAQFAIRGVVEVALELLQLVEVGVPAFFEFVDVGVGDFYLFEADEFDGCVGVLVAARVDVVFFV